MGTALSESANNRRIELQMRFTFGSSDTFAIKVACTGYTVHLQLPKTYREVSKKGDLISA